MTNIAKGALKGVTYYNSLKADDGYSLFGTKESEGDWIDVVLINYGGLYSESLAPAAPDGCPRSAYAQRAFSLSRHG